MSLRIKTFLIIIATTLLLVIVLYLSSWMILLNGYTRLEENETRKNVSGAAASLGDIQARMISSIKDWANWNETYYFVQGTNPSYVDSNLIDQTFENLGLNLFVLLKPNGEIYYQKAYDLIEHKQAAISRDLDNNLSISSPFLADIMSKETSSGYILLADQVMMVVAAPVLTNHFEGPATGILIMGKVLNQETLDRISENTKSSIKIQRLDRLSDLPEYQTAQPLLKTDEIIVSTISANEIVGYLQYEDIYHKPAFLLRVNQPRDIYKQGINSLNYYLIVIFVVCILFGTFILTTTERYFIRRTELLVDEVNKISSSGKLAQRIIIPEQTDDLTQLANQINNMLDVLEISEKVRHENEERYTLAVRGANDGIWDWNLKTNFTYYSPRWKNILGFSEEELSNSIDEWFKRIHPDDVEWVKAEIDAHLQGKTSHFESEHRIQHRDGTYRWVLSRGLSIQEENQKPHRIAGSVTDITVRKATEERLRYEALHDPLTCLPNRSYFMEQLTRAIEKTRRHTEYMAALLFIDLDRFKLVNDSLDHVIGDMLLVSFSRRIERILRAEDMFARFGGDEFAILLENVFDTQIATQVASRIMNELSLPFDIDGHRLIMTASIGITFTSLGYQRAEDMLRDADTATYRAKANGKARYEIFGTEMHARSIELLTGEMELRRAIEAEEFKVYYQPVYDLTSGQMSKVEALIRWQHPTRGMILPGGFISLAEETGLIVPINTLVLRAACLEMKKWCSKWGLHIPVAVNISVKQIQDNNLPRVIEQVLDEIGITSDALQIEITESAAMTNYEVTIRTLQEINRMGLHISLDDFGTGYSSLAYLRRFPISSLKIDRSFIHDAISNPDDAAIVNAIIAMGHVLHLDVIAEGVERPEQVDFLIAQNCNMAQGFLFCPPVPIENLLPAAIDRNGIAKTRPIYPRDNIL